MKKNIDLSQYEPLFVDNDKILKKRFLTKLLFAVILLVCVALLSSCSGARQYENCGYNRWMLYHGGEMPHRFHVGVTG